MAKANKADKAEVSEKVQAVKRRILPPPSSSIIPHVAEIADWDAEELASVMDTMEEAVQLRGVIDKAEVRLKELKETLTGVAIGHNAMQYRSDTVKVNVSQQSRTTLNKERLLEHVPASVLEECYEKGAEFYTTRIDLIR